MSSSEPNANSNIVEVDGILFETLMPVQTIRVPQTGEQVPVQFGVCITNRGSTPYRFDLPKFIPEIFDGDGRKIEYSVNSNARQPTEEQDIPLINPGEYITHWINVDLYWRGENCFGFGGFVRYGSVWSTYSFGTGTYQLQLRYVSQLSRHRVVFLGVRRNEIDGFWVGTVSTPLVKFNLVNLKEP